jgi:hypothetical protein
LAVLLLVLLATGSGQAEDVQLSPDVLTVPFSSDNGTISLSLISGDSDTNLFVFELTLENLSGLVSSPVFIRSTAATISSVGVIDAGNFSTFDSLIQVPERVDLQLVANTPSAVGVLEIQFQGTPTQIEFFNNFGNSVTATIDIAVDVDIDVKPDSPSNCINTDAHGVIPVAILGTDTFDVRDVDVSTLLLNGFEVRMRAHRGPLCSHEDSNGDSFLDVVCHFEDSGADDWIEGTATATLTGALVDGTPIIGTDSICIVP